MKLRIATLVALIALSGIASAKPCYKVRFGSDNFKVTVKPNKIKQEAGHPGKYCKIVKVDDYEVDNNSLKGNNPMIINMKVINPLNGYILPLTIKYKI